MELHFRMLILKDNTHTALDALHTVGKKHGETKVHKSYGI